MEHAHNQGIVHRDLKPSNIMFTSNETLKILDFGIAKVENQLLTAQGMAMGTPDYMSPEQARGGADVDLRTDIYAVGCIMYRMLSGRLPFSGETAFDTMSQHQTEPVPELRFDSDPDIVRTFNEIIQRSLAKDKNERYASMSALKADLAAIDLREEAPSPVTVSQPALPTETKFPRWILPTVILLFIVLTAAVMSHKPEKTDATPKGFLKAEYQPRDSGYFPFHVITRYGSSWWEPVYQFGVTDEDLKKLSDRTRHPIYFSYCPKVTGAGLRYLSHWTDLRGIDMTDCPVTDKNLELLENFKNLTMLDLNSCRFITGASLPHLPKLERANFNSCKGLTDAGVKNISRSKNLLSLRLSFSGVSHKCLDDVTQLVRLTDLELSGLGITDRDLPKLLKLRELNSLALSENPISDNGLKVLAELPSLKTLTLDSCKNITQSGIDKLTKSRLAKSASFTVSHDKDLKHEKFDQVNDAEILLGDPVVDKL